MMLSGQFRQTASGRQSYEIANADWMMVASLVKIATEFFGFTSRLPVYGFEELYIDCKRDNLEITVGWEYWSGCFVMGYSPESDEFVRVMGDYVEHMMADWRSREPEL